MAWSKAALREVSAFQVDEERSSTHADESKRVVEELWATSDRVFADRMKR